MIRNITTETGVVKEGSGDEEFDLEPDMDMNMDMDMEGMDEMDDEDINIEDVDNQGSALNMADLGTVEPISGDDFLSQNTIEEGDFCNIEKKIQQSIY